MNIYVEIVYKGGEISMDFSLKQALGVVVVVAVAALVLITAIALTNSNNENATEQTDALWQQAADQIQP
jgi:uncharacterized protein (UPF0333 family)